ncbi:MAG: site-specific integrase [Desulforhopalus sp.]|nr:site-specific integrase [Desulforhopalus sp.]
MSTKVYTEGNQTIENSPTTLFTAKKTTAIGSHRTAAKIFTFTDIQDAFFKEKEVAQAWREKTEEDHKAVFNLFLEIFGDIPADAIDKGIMRDFKAVIVQLPPNMRKIPKFTTKSIAEIIATKPKKTLSAHTVNKYISRLSNLFSFAVSHGYMQVNPAGGFKVKLHSRPDEEREAYTIEDLQKLFDTPDTSQPSRYWAPLIALYAGCRLEEICQLHLEDIRQEGDVWVFDINNRGEKVLKNLSSVRLVPIHPQLVDLGLLKYTEQLKARGETRLFPELRRRRDGYGQMVGRWFQYFKKLRGIGQGKTFHSFRHTFITHLKHKQVDPFMIHELDGHTINSETMGRYGKRYTPEILLREAIEKIDYGIELNVAYQR